MRRILLPLDGSELADRAVPFAATLAARTGQPLLLLRAVDPLSAANAAEEERLAHEASAALEATAAWLAAHGARAELEVAHDPPDVAILDAAGRPDVGLVVMSTHGRGGLDRWLHGSIADAVLRDAPTPVLIVPAQGVEAWSDTAPKILVPLDGSDRARAALGPAQELARVLRGSLVLASVVPFPQYVAYAEGYAFIEPDPNDAALAQMRAYLEEIAEPLRAAGLAVEVSVAYGSAYSGVTATAEAYEAAAVVMATHGRGGVARALLGSVATATIRQAGVPVLLVRPDESGAVPELIFGTASAEALLPTVAAEDEADLAPPAAAEASGPAITLLLTPDELELLTRVLGQQFHLQPVDPRRAEPMRALLEKLRRARPATAAAEPALSGRA